MTVKSNVRAGQITCLGRLVSVGSAVIQTHESQNKDEGRRRHGQRFLTGLDGKQNSRKNLEVYCLTEILKSRANQPGFPLLA